MPRNSTPRREPFPPGRTYAFIIEGDANVAHFRRQEKRRPTSEQARRVAEELNFIFGYGPKPQGYQEPKGPPSYADQ